MRDVLNTPRTNPVSLRLTGFGILAMLVVVGLVVFAAMTLAGWITVPQGHFVVLIK
jgi:hypothetical protein